MVRARRVGTMSPPNDDEASEIEENYEDAVDGVNVTMRGTPNAEDYREIQENYDKTIEQSYDDMRLDSVKWDSSSSRDTSSSDTFSSKLLTSYLLCCEEASEEELRRYACSLPLDAGTKRKRKRVESPSVMSPGFFCLGAAGSEEATKQKQEEVNNKKEMTKPKKVKPEPIKTGIKGGGDGGAVAE